MNKITLRPLLDFLNKQQRPYMTWGDWQQLENKINNRRADKIKAGQSAVLEDEYLKMLTPLRKLFTGHPQVKNTKIIAALNKILIQQRHGYKKQQHRARHRGNVFYPADEKSPGDQMYDIAFYSAAAGRKHAAHHRHENESSVYYIRCEERGEQILFGNMQIDAREPALWADPGRAEIMLQKKNIYGMIVQHALKHALERNKKEILFQGGTANEFSQWGVRQLKTVKVTKRNYNKFLANYENQINKFADGALMVGDFLQPPKEAHKRYYVTAVGADWYQIYEQAYTDITLLHTLKNPVARGPGVIPGCSAAETSDFIHAREVKLLARYSENEHGNLLTEIKNCLRLLFWAELPEQHSAAELAAVKKVLPAKTHPYDFSRHLDLLWHELGYEKLFFQHFPALKKLVLNTDNTQVIYYNPHQRKFNRVFKKSDLQAPEIGKSYITPREDRYNINFCCDTNSRFAGFARIHNWYEKTLQQEFKKYGLTAVKVPLTTTKRGRSVTASAWKIETGLKEFARRPLTIFSTRTNLKMDCETLPALQTAAAKFGCRPEQLTIVNDFLTGGPTPKHTGSYNPRTGEIHLANRSLAVLAHEGLHKLKARGVIPRTEYHALVQAGKRITRSRPQEMAYINQRDKQDNLIYPPGRKRNEEYAAVFVETYYENSRLARKNLLGVKLSVTEKVLNYIKTVSDALQAQLGLPAAQARNFLRQVEKNYYQGAARDSQSPSPAALFQGAPALAPVTR